MTDKKLVSVSDILNAESVSRKLVIADMKSLKQIEVVDYGTFKPKAKADVTGQPGTYLYTVQGKERTYLLGADMLAQLSLETNLEIEMIEAKAKAFPTSKLFTVLRNALIRQRDKTLETEDTQS